MPRLRSIDRKLSRQADARRILLKTLATQLVEYGRITTTRPRAKALVPYVERLVTTAKGTTLSTRRYTLSRLDTVEAAHRLVDVIAPQLKRDSGFVRLKAADARKGDDAPMASVEFVDKIEEISRVKAAPTKVPAKKKTSSKPSKPANPKRLRKGEKA